MISAFDIFKIGIGPSSSHTVGPMNAGKCFIDRLIDSGDLPRTTRITVDLYGSLSLTGKGHATDTAVIMGLAGNTPQDVNIDSIPAFIQEVARSSRLSVAGGAHVVDFPVADSIFFHAETLARHENGMRITAWHGQTPLLHKTYYSIGGGFIVEEERFGQSHDVEKSVPYDFHSASELLTLCERQGLSVSGLMMQNELALRSKEQIDAGFARIWQVMATGIERGMNTEGVLPGPLNVPRRAVALRRLLVSSDNLSRDPMNVIDWINMFALAVSEENRGGRASGHRADQRRVRHYSCGAGLLRQIPSSGQCQLYRPLSVVGGGNWHAVQDERLDIRRGSGVSGRGWRRVFDGGGRADRTAGR